MSSPPNAPSLKEKEIRNLIIGTIRYTDESKFQSTMGPRRYNQLEFKMSICFYFPTLSSNQEEKIPIIREQKS